MSTLRSSPDRDALGDQADWLAGALEIHRQTAGKWSKSSSALQELIDRMIAAAPQVQRIRVLADRCKVLRFAREDGGRLLYRGREVVPVSYKDPVCPCAGRGDVVIGQLR